MVIDESLFFVLDKSVITKVKFGDGKIVQAQHKRSVAVSTQQGIKLIHFMLFITYCKNLLSVVQLLLNSHSLFFKDN